jgi:hypothetical protein
VEGLLPKLQVEAPLKQLSKKECYQAIIWKDTIT